MWLLVARPAKENTGLMDPDHAPCFAGLPEGSPPGGYNVVQAVSGFERSSPRVWVTTLYKNSSSHWTAAARR